MTYTISDQTTRVADVFVDSGYPETFDTIHTHVTNVFRRVRKDGYDAGVSMEMGSGVYDPLDTDAVIAELHETLSHDAAVFVNNRELIITELENCWYSGYAEGSWDS